MATVDPTTLNELVQRQLDGDLPSHERRTLEEGLRRAPDLAVERKQLQSLVADMEAARIPVREGFQAQVMAELPSAAWEARAARSWRVPVALLVALVGSLVALARWAPEGFQAQGPLAGTLAAVGDLLVVSVLTGAGLLGASWKGLQAGAVELFTTSPMTAMGLIALVLGLNIFFFLGLRSRRKAPAEEPATKP